MKKIFFALFCLFLIIVSCSKSTDNAGNTSISINTHAITLTHNEDKEIKVSTNSQNYISSYVKNDFVAETHISNNIVTISADHVGETWVYVKCDNSIDSCKVTVEPTINMFQVPYIKYGDSYNDLIKLMGNDYLEGADNTGLWYVNTSKLTDTGIQRDKYLFDKNNKLSAVQTSLEIYPSYHNRIGDVESEIIERYEYIRTSGYTRVYKDINGNFVTSFGKYNENNIYIFTINFMLKD